MRLVLDPMRLGEQLSLFGKTQQVRVKAHARVEKGGKITQVQEHGAARRKAHVEQGAGPVVDLDGVSWQAAKRAAREVVVLVDVRALDAAWRALDPGFHVNAGGVNSQAKYDRYRTWRETAAGPSIMPELGIGKGGMPVFTNGRHRFAYHRDQGAAVVPVTVPVHEARTVRDLFGAEEVEEPLERLERGEPAQPVDIGRVAVFEQRWLTEQPKDEWGIIALGKGQDIELTPESTRQNGDADTTAVVSVNQGQAQQAADDGEAVVSHWHPIEQPLSGPDIEAAIGMNARAIRAVLPSGRVHELRRVGQDWPPGMEGRISFAFRNVIREIVKLPWEERGDALWKQWNDALWQFHNEQTQIRWSHVEK